MQNTLTNCILCSSPGFTVGVDSLRELCPLYGVPLVGLSSGRTERGSIITLKVKILVTFVAKQLVTVCSTTSILAFRYSVITAAIKEISP